jgi:DNA-binding transcriptional ArsR family regulator
MTPLLNRRRPDDHVFAALSSAERRVILVALRDRGPLTRSDVEGLLPDISHEAVGRHLNALMSAGLVVRYGVGGTHRVRYRRDNSALGRALRRIGANPVWVPPAAEDREAS